jgi:hypothetical protein
LAALPALLRGGAGQADGGRRARVDPHSGIAGADRDASKAVTLDADRLSQFSTTSDLPLLTTMPALATPLPSMSRPLRLTASAAPALIVMPVPPLPGEMPAKPWPWMRPEGV